MIKTLIDCVGEELVFIRNYDENTLLHAICEYSDSSPRRPYLDEVINFILCIGGQDLLLARNRDDRTAIEFEARKLEPSQSVLDRFIEVGGEKVVSLLANVRQRQ